MRTLFELFTEVVRIMTFQQASRTRWTGQNSDRSSRCDGDFVSRRSR
jgi:hypothetical protein